MRKVLCCVVGLSLFTAGSAFATGYQIPVQSYNSVAKAGANVASASGADAAYYNPAGAAWVKDGWVMQANATYLHLTKAEYYDYRTGTQSQLGTLNFDGTSLTENFLLPTFFLLSPTWKDFRFGFSLTAPYGLSKRWEDGYASVYSHKFSLQVFEFNPTITYALSDKFSIAGGARMLYAKGTVINQAGAPYPYLGTIGTPLQGLVPPTATLSRGMDGSATEWGYNLAADFRPTKELNLAVTFRSRVDLNLTGEGIMQTNVSTLGTILPVSNRGSISIPAPAVLSFAISYDFGKTTAELGVARTYWSKLKSLDFKYATNPANPATGGNVLFANFIAPEPRDWHDTTAVKLGLEYEATKKLTLMAGVAYSESPAPDYTLSFELPDSDTWAFSVGGRYAFTDNLEVGLGVLYDTAMTRWVGGRSGSPSQTNLSGMNGEITNEAALLVTLGLQYRF